MGRRVVLIATYEIGRQPFGLAAPAALLRSAGADVDVQDLAVRKFDSDQVRHADLVGIHVPMHTATRLAEPVLERVRELNLRACVCVFGLYAPMNEAHLRALGADVVLGGEVETSLVELYRQTLSQGRPRHQNLPIVSLDRVPFVTPDRTRLPPLQEYAHLVDHTGRQRVVGYTEASRGCKHVCRHCPVVPIYNGRFRAVPRQVVLSDIEQQVTAGAEHITFGDPDFLNGPTHALRIVQELHERWPALSYDVTIKVEHMVQHADVLPVLKNTGCAFVTTAVESFDDQVLRRLDKRHSVADLECVMATTRPLGLPLNPTFVAFTPWMSFRGYRDFLAAIARFGLIETVSPVQYAIRLLVPAGSRLLELPELQPVLGPFDEDALCYPWTHPDEAVDRLHQTVMSTVTAAQRAGHTRREIFAAVWRAADGPRSDPPPDQAGNPVHVPYLTEPWYCCAEPTEEQLALDRL